MFAIFRLFSMVTSVIAFFTSPTGRRLIERARAILTDPANRQRAAALVSRFRRPRHTQS